MANPTASSAGSDDGIFVQKLRDFIEDPPLFAPQQISANGTSSEYRLSGFPVWDADSQFSVKVGGVAQTLDPSRAALGGAGHVYVDYETGWLYWNPANPPASGSNNIQIRCSRVRWRDAKLQDALYAGLRAMFPSLWQVKVDQTSIALAINQWDYPLPVNPNGTNDWLDPRTRLFAVEVQLVPAAYERFQPLQIWRRTGLTNLQIPYSQHFPPGSLLRLQWAGPYSSLSDLEGQAEQLPLWYAKGYLLSNRETVRVRFDQANVTQNEQANPPGISQNAGTFFMRQFETELARLKRVMPMGPIQYTGTR